MTPNELRVIHLCEAGALVASGIILLVASIRAWIEERRMRKEFLNHD